MTMNTDEIVILVASAIGGAAVIVYLWTNGTLQNYLVNSGTKLPSTTGAPIVTGQTTTAYNKGVLASVGGNIGVGAGGGKTNDGMLVYYASPTDNPANYLSTTPTIAGDTYSSPYYTALSNNLQSHYSAV